MDEWWDTAHGSIYYEHETGLQLRVPTAYRRMASAKLEKTSRVSEMINVGETEKQLGQNVLVPLPRLPVYTEVVMDITELEILDCARFSSRKVNLLLGMCLSFPHVPGYAHDAQYLLPVGQAILNVNNGTTH